MDFSKCAIRCFSSIGVLVTISHCEVLVVSLFPSVELNFVRSLIIVGVSFYCACVWVGRAYIFTLYRKYIVCTSSV